MSFKSLLRSFSFWSIVAVFALCLLAFLTWGTEQAISESYLLDRLERGVTCREACFNIALSGDVCDTYQELSDKGRSVAISNAGTGSWFIPQRNIRLTFDRFGKLEECRVETVYRLDEHGYTLNLGPHDQVRDELSPPAAN
jgi:hypothetical protein